MSDVDPMILAMQLQPAAEGAAFFRFDFVAREEAVAFASAAAALLIIELTPLALLRRESTRKI